MIKGIAKKVLRIVQMIMSNQWERKTSPEAKLIPDITAQITLIRTAEKSING